jgi:selenocysteine lyase/cysteine desulfurase
VHTPLDSELAGGISCFEITGLSAREVAGRLAQKKIRTNSSPYKVSYARVAAGIMNTPDDIATVLRGIRSVAAM